ncbi:MAG: iron-containing alcohol dehydrogenase [bacterium]|nr:iron-containing alcohol dehydrogenase [bacterium]
MSSSEFSLPTRIVSGPGSIQRLGGLAAELGARSALVVSDPGVTAVGHPRTAAEILANSNIVTRLFDAANENPDENDAETCRRAIAHDTDLIVAVGGGSSIDVAKGAAFLHAGGGRMRDYRGRGTANGTLLPIIAIPTTAGTGSEVQSFALISHAETHQKMACGDRQAAPRIAILDAELTLSQPRFVAACTGLDTVAHAVESAVTRVRTSMSSMFAREAFALAAHNLPRVLATPDDLTARSAMLRASACAGVAIENSMLGAAHSMANPLTAHHGIVHGQAVGVTLPTVVEFNANDPATAREYAELARAAGLVGLDQGTTAAVAALIGQLRELIACTGFEDALAEIPTTAIDGLADEAAEQWTAQHNPRAVGPHEFRDLFGAVLS